MDQGGCVSMTRTWGFLATNVPDPPACVLSCRQDFLRGLALEDETLDVVCEALRDTAAMASVSVSASVSASESRSTLFAPAIDDGSMAIFWALYCCDAQRCGVDNLRGRGQDPNVNWFINSCQNIGHSAVVDPGPPDQAYHCDGSISNEPDTLTRCDNLAGHPNSESVPSLTTTLWTSTVSQTDSIIHDPSSLAATSEPTQPNSSEDGSDDGNERDGLSTGAKVTIALATLAAIVLALLAVAAFLRYWAGRLAHRRNLGRYLQARYHELHPSSSFSARIVPPTPPPPPLPARPLLSSPPTRLPADSGFRLMPPPPLRERRLLSDAHPAAPSSDAQRRPRQRQRHGRHARDVSASGQALLFTKLPAAPPSIVPPPERGTLDRMSCLPPRPLTTMSTSTSASSTTPLTMSRAGGSKTASPPSSYAYRGHGATLALSASSLRSLRSPGPPPTKELPSTPPNSLLVNPPRSSSPSPTWPSTPASSSARRVPGEVGVTVGLVSRNPATGVMLDHESRDLCDLTEQTHYELRGAVATNTGGSSSSRTMGRLIYGGGSAPPPVSAVHRSNGSVRVGSPVLEEVDLERMAGGY